MSREECGEGLDMTASELNRSIPGRFAIDVLLLVVLGGAIGALARYGADALNPDTTSTDEFPYGTFLANVSGAFGLGLLAAILARVQTSWIVRPLVATGFLGAYTTFSTFAVEVATRIEDGYWGVAVFYAATTLVVGFVLVLVGHTLGERVRAGRGDSP